MEVHYRYHPYFGGKILVRRVEQTRRTLLDATHQNLPAGIRVKRVTDFQLLPDMGRMNG